MKNLFISFAALALLAGCSRREEITRADLVKTLKEDKNPDMRAWAARELGRLPGNDAAGNVHALTLSLQDAHDDVRMAAAYGLADLGAEATPAVPALTKAKQDAAARVRTAATYALKQIQGKK